jgi:hypothetical protein
MLPLGRSSSPIRAKPTIITKVKGGVNNVCKNNPANSLRSALPIQTRQVVLRKISDPQPCPPSKINDQTGLFPNIDERSQLLKI